SKTGASKPFFGAGALVGKTIGFAAPRGLPTRFTTPFLSSTGNQTSPAHATGPPSARPSPKFSTAYDKPIRVGVTAANPVVVGRYKVAQRAPSTTSIRHPREFFRPLARIEPVGRSRGIQVFESGRSMRRLPCSDSMAIKVGDATSNL